MNSQGKAFFAATILLEVLFIGVLVLAAPEGGEASPSATFSVNSTIDINDGTCDETHCSLREAINAANSAAGADRIEFTLPPSSTITLAGFQLAIISDNLTIDGRTTENLTVSGNNASRIFEVGSGTVVTLTKLIIAEGNCPGCVTGGGIKNSGTLIVSNSTIKNSYDGGIYNNGGTLIIITTLFDNNDNGGGGAIFNSGTLTVNSSIFTNNDAFVRGFPGGAGGAIFNTGTASISGSFFDGNSATGTGESYGGAVFNNLDGILTISNSTFTGLENFGADFGGAIYNGGMLTLTNSTISDNYAVIVGGGIANYGTAVINNSSIIDNASAGFSGGGLYNEGVLDISNTIIAYSPNGGDCANAGTINTNINNLIEDGTCSPAISGDPILGPLLNNGGLGPTHAPLSGSPVIDSGDNANCEQQDQRYVPRPIDGDGNGTAVCDIGAVEVGEKRVLMPLILKMPD